MGKYPTPDGYVGSGDDGEIMRTGTGGRLAYDPNASFQTTDDRRNLTSGLFGHTDNGDNLLGFPVEPN